MRITTIVSPSRRLETGNGCLGRKAAKPVIIANESRESDAGASLETELATLRDDRQLHVVAAVAGVRPEMHRISAGIVGAEPVERLVQALARRIGPRALQGLDQDLGRDARLE